LKKEEYYTCLDGNLDSLSGFESTKSYVDREVLHVERIENKYALFNRFGKKLTPYKYKKIEIENILIEDKYYTSSYIVNSNKIDLYTSTGELYKSNLDTTEINKLKVLPKYAKKGLEIYANCGGSLMVKKIQPDGNYLFGMLDGKDNWLVPLIYDRASPDFFDDEIWFSRIENKERISYVAECDGEMTRLGTYDKIYLQYSSYIGIRDGKSYIIDEDEINVEHALPIKKTSFGEQIYYYTLPGSKPELVWAKERNLKRLSSEIMLDSELPELVRLEEDRFLFYLNKRLYLLSNQAEVLEEFDAEIKSRANTFYHFIVKNTPLLKIKFDGEEYYYNYKTLTKFKQ